MIESAISDTRHTRRTTTTAIVAKLAVCAILVAGVAGAHAATGDGATRAIRKAAAKKPASQARLARLERDWKRLHGRGQHGALDRLVACGEYGQCNGLKVPPTLGAVRIRSAAADDGDQGGVSPLASGAASGNP